MPAIDVAKPRPLRLSQAGLAGLILAAGIAWLAPFDHLFALATLDLPPLRATGIVGLALIGAAVSRSIGLRLVPPPGRRRAILLPLLVAVAVATGCAMVDVAFRPILPHAYVEAMTRVPLAIRVPVYLAHAYNEEILYRLFLGPVLAWLLLRATTRGAGRPRPMTLGLAFALAQGVNLAANLGQPTHPGPALWAYDLLRFFVPGMVWAWLCVRRGFVTAQAAHMATHVIFQPLAGLLLAT